MTRFWHIFGQIVGTAAQGFNLMGHVIPAKAQGPVAVGISLAQLVLANFAHNSNPDGTPATEPYVKPILDK